MEAEILPPKSIQVAASLLTPVKVNLALHVVGQRDDGYHLLQSLVCFALDGDVLQYQQSAKDDFYIEGRYAPNDMFSQGFSVTEAYSLMLAHFPQFAKPCRLTLTKNLPISSGVGGGSGDAAAVLHILSKAWGVEAEEKQLYDLALSLGADVPMCLSSLRDGHNLLVENIGEKITELPKMCRLHLVLINHGQAIATPEIFKRLKNKDNPSFSFRESDLTTVESCIALLKNMRNDLYPPALEIAPKLKEILALLDENGALLARMSGSGATCFGIYKDEESAKKSALKISQENPDWYVKAVTTLGVESLGINA